MNKLKLLLFTILLATAISAQNGYDIGALAADFNLENIDGSFVSLSDFSESKGFIVVFTCNTCPYAVAYEDRIEALNKKYAKKGYPVIAIMPNNTEIKPGDSLDAMRKRANKKGFTFPYLIDREQAVFPQYGATKTPHVYVLQKNNEMLTVRYIGAIDDNYKDANKVVLKYVEDAVDALLMNRKVPVSKTRAIGCSIKI
ncbi:MAG: Thiol-disulfide oxidoreductase ResA [Formosa sp. Hel3_A1_48]|jgi:peroxiredoxin|nr:MAG: Thiol-disulfide oxidoreductase ResA [Formosa sp. Hel3_A1_48]